MKVLTKIRRGSSQSIILILLLFHAAARGQTSQEPADERRTIESVNTPSVTTSSIATDRIAREIDDPSSGARWLLVQGDDHPGGPGQLILVSSHEQNGTAAASHQRLNSKLQLPVIRAGDALIVEEHTSLLDARFDAVALGPALIGSVFRARLKLREKIVQAVASGPGHATLTSETEGWK